MKEYDNGNNITVHCKSIVQVWKNGDYEIRVEGAEIAEGNITEDGFHPLERLIRERYEKKRED